MKALRQIKKLFVQGVIVGDWGRVVVLRHWFRVKRWPGPNPFSLQTINPANVELIQAGDPHDKVFNNRGRFDPKRPQILDGDWDQRVIRIQDTCLYRGLEQHFKSGLPWEQTCLSSSEYTDGDRNLPAKYRRFDMAGFSKRAKYLDELYESLGHGYRNYIARRDWFWNEVTINIGRNTKLIYNSSGLHRLILGQLRGLKEVQARILVVHSDALKSRETETAC
jgi:hypothetical protein